LNYFELHVGDYDAATAHLSMLEDAAYGRMMRIYYRTEKPLPADLKQVCRLVRAQTRPERDAVQAVLDEFFELQDDGWHQARCDQELQAYRDREPEREAKKANEETRLRRHRDERAALFRALTDAGHHAPWNIKIEALRERVEALQAGRQPKPATAPATAPETPVPPLPATAPATPATATHGNVPPPPTSHLPDTRDSHLVSVAAKPRPSRKAPKSFGLTPELRAWAAEHAPLVDPDAELAKLRDHTFATAREDWPGTLRNWLRKAQEDHAARPRRPPPGNVEPLWRAEQRQRTAAFAGPAAARPATPATLPETAPETHLPETVDAATRLLG
jgi:uncharacterized protein YdaU (DUF1376 family)